MINRTTGNLQKKKLDTVLKLIETGTSFDILAEKFSDINPRGNNGAGWVLEDNLDNETRLILERMQPDEIKKNIKMNNGYRVIKLNKKRKFGKEGSKFTFYKFSSFNKNDIETISELSINCNSYDQSKLKEEIKVVRIDDIIAKDLSNIFLTHINVTPEKQFTNIFEIDGDYNLLYICKKKESDIEPISRDLVERKAFSKKFNQLSNTFISNIRKSANIKFFNK